MEYSILFKTKLTWQTCTMLEIKAPFSTDNTILPFEFNDQWSI